MRIIGLLSWYDEDPEWLREMIASLPVDELVAVDGAYDLYPGGELYSPQEQYEAIADACAQAAIPLTTAAGDTWDGNEVEKRSWLFELGEDVTDPGDWYMVIDADEIVTEVPSDLRERLEQTDLDVAEVTFFEPIPPAHANGRRTNRYPIRIFFRAIPGIKVVGTHYTYVTPDGRKLWGPGRRSLEPTLDLTDFEILHRSVERNARRQAEQTLYYEMRTMTGAEMGNCCRCGAKATKVIAQGWELEQRGLIADWVDACDGCAREIEADNATRLKSFDLDPITGRPDPKLAAIR